MALFTAGLPLTAAALNTLVVTPTRAIWTGSAPITVTSPNNGATVNGFSFTAPESGAIMVISGGDIDGGSDIALLGWRVRTGSSVGSGTIVDGSEPGDGYHDGAARLIADGIRLEACTMAFVTGLTAGDTYNICNYYYISGGSGTLRLRQVEILPIGGPA